MYILTFLPLWAVLIGSAKTTRVLSTRIASYIATLLFRDCDNNSMYRGEANSRGECFTTLDILLFFFGQILQFDFVNF
jgi:hypothetical protein